MSAGSTDATGSRALPAPFPVLWDRCVGIAFAASGTAITLLLRSTQPDPRGFGTHEQLGMLPCSWPGAVGMPCPTCGVTTAAAHLVHLEPLQALVAQPFGAALAAAGLWLAAKGALTAITGRPLVERMARWPHGRLLLWTAALLLVSWAYKVATYSP